MIRLAIAITAITISTAAWAGCPPGTAYNCYPAGNGKQSCGCR